MTTAAGVLARAAPTSTAASRSSTPLRSQYSPSATTRLNAGVRRLMLVASPNTAGAGVITTAVGSKRGNQTSGALSPRNWGSTGKPEPPASRQSFREVGLAGCPLGSCSKVAIVVRIAPEEFPRKLGAIEVLQVGIGGRISPVRCCWHVGPRNDAILVRVARPVTGSLRKRLNAACRSRSDGIT